MKKMDSKPDSSPENPQPESKSDTNSDREETPPANNAFGRQNGFRTRSLGKRTTGFGELLELRGIGMHDTPHGKIFFGLAFADFLE